jgi:hypothetical protein
MLQTLRIETKVMLLSVAITLVFWILRGVGLMTFLPGIVISVLLMVSIGCVMYWALQQLKRF